MAKTRIVLTGHGGSRNRGCEAIVRSTVDIIHRHVGPVDINLISYHPDSDRVALGHDIAGLNIHDFFAQRPSRLSSQWWMIKVNRLAQQYPRLNRLGLKYLFPVMGFSEDIVLNRTFYRNSRAVIQIGGDNLCYHSEEHLFEELHFARVNGARTVIWAASIGPFRQEEERKWAAELRKVDLITIREDLSLEYLQKLEVIENVKRVSDPAFLLQASSDSAPHLSRKEGDMIVGLGMSALVSEYGSGQADYLDAFADFATALLSDLTIKLVLIPHVIYESLSHNDFVVCESLANRLNMPDRVIVLGNGYNACQTKYVISQCDYFIGARTHSTIASFSTGVPTLSIAYSTKAYGINRDIFGHTDYVVPIAGLNETILLEKFGLLRRDRQKIIDQLAKSVPMLKEAADRGGQYLAELIKRRRQ